MTSVAQKFKGEASSVLRRWELESDIPDDELAILAMEVVDEFLEAKGKTVDVEFAADEGLMEEVEEEDDGEYEETGDDI